MNIWLIVALALAPSAFIAAYIVYRDRRAPEPPGMLLRAFAGGLLSPLLSIPSVSYTHLTLPTNREV